MEEFIQTRVLNFSVKTTLPQCNCPSYTAHKTYLSVDWHSYYREHSFQQEKTLCIRTCTRVVVISICFELYTYLYNLSIDTFEICDELYYIFIDIL